MHKIIHKIIDTLPQKLVGPVIRNAIDIDKSKVNGLIFKIADNLEERQKAYKLLYDTYLSIGYARQNRSEMRIVAPEILKNTSTFICKYGSEVIFTCSLILDSEHGLPSDEVYKNEIDNLRQSKKLIVELGSLAAHKDFRKYNHNILYFITKATFIYWTEYLAANAVVISVHPKHRFIYEHILLFKQIGGLKPMQAVQGVNVIGMALDLDKVYENYEKTYSKKPAHKNLYQFYVFEKDDCIVLPSIKKPVEWDEESYNYFLTKKMADLG